MERKKAEVIVPVPASAASGNGDRVGDRVEQALGPAGETWLQRHGWKLGGGLAVLTFGGLLWRRRQRRLRAADLQPVTTQWLADHEYEAGQRGDED